MAQIITKDATNPNVQPERENIQNRVDFLEKNPPIYASVLGVIAILAIWELACQMKLVSPLALPSPSAIVISGWEMLTSGEISSNVAASLFRIGGGFVIGSLLGISIGLFLGLFKWVESVLSPVIYAIYPIPKIALLPLFILWMGIGETPKVTIIALGVFFPVVINTFSGVKNVDLTLIKAAAIFGSSQFGIMRKVILPASLPMIFAGLRLAAGNSLLLLVAAEMIAAEKGIGSLILRYGNLMITTKLMVGVVVLSVLGLVFTYGLASLERKLLPWK